MGIWFIYRLRELLRLIVRNSLFKVFSPSLAMLNLSILKNPIYFRNFFWIIILLSLPEIASLILSPDRLFYDFFLHLALRACYLLIPVYIFRNHLKIYYWLLIPFILLSSLVLASTLFFNIRITPEVILAVVNTNAREAMELSRGYVFIYLLILLTMVLTYIYLVLALPSRLPGRKSLYISLVAVGAFLLLPLFQKADDSYPEKMKNTFFTTFPNSFMHDAADVYLMYRKMADNAEIRNRFEFRAKQINAPGLRQIYILIIGESSRAVQWGINGYYRNTSPKLVKRTNLVSFSNTVAGGYMTEYTVPQIISEATPDNFQLQNTEKSIVSAFKEAGFKTYWMSNNLDYGHIQMHAKEADEFWYNIDSHPMDMDMVDKEFRRVLDKNENKVFIVIHTYGSHWSYFERYPPSYEIFKPVVKNIGVQHSDVAKKNYLINSYDNSILYSDALIDTVIAMTEKKDACSSVFFISDHGEDLLDDNREKFTHGSGPPSKYVAHIPFFIWYSDKLKEIFPEKIKWLYVHKDRKTGTENVFPSLAEMGALKFPSLDTTKSVLNPAFTDSRQKIMGEDAKVYDYESLF